MKMLVTCKFYYISDPIGLLLVKKTKQLYKPKYTLQVEQESQS